uniref:PCI domain-containing protein 2 homolog n=1 Tax=Romanomermis culicivorax TaxID=13658 RepID=A0A915J3T7_ROMCU
MVDIGYWVFTFAGPLNSRSLLYPVMELNTEDIVSQIMQELERDDWESGLEIATCISLKPLCQNASLSCDDNDKRLCIGTLYQPFGQIVYNALRVALLVRKQKFEDAYKIQAQNADAHPSQPIPPEQSSYYEQAASCIMECYRSCVADIRATIENSKRLAILNLTNQLFRIYFRINKLNLLKPLIRAIENCGALYDNFSMADKVTYKYFTGRKAMFDSDFKSAESCLSFAYRNCYPDCEANKRLILIYLVPVKMFLGHMPASDLLIKHNLTEFIDVAAAVKQGNLMKLEEALTKYEPFFIQCGIFLMLEKLKIITYRTLFKKVCAILNVYQVPLDSFLTALKFMQVEDVDSDEVACIVANLIYQGKIKGYISHQHQKLVISKQNAFPPLSSITS